MIRVAFVMEQHLGHQTYYENLRRFIEPSSSIDSTWVPVTYTQADSWWNRIPLLPAKLRGPLIGRDQVRTGLSRGAYDAALFNTQIPAVISGNVVGRQPYILCTDITPIQYDRMAAFYGHQADKPGLLQKLKHQVNCRLFQRAAKVLPWSSWTGASLRQDYGVHLQKIEVIPPGVDIDVWQPGTKRSDGPIRILFVGGDFYRKGGDRLLEACEHLQANKQLAAGSIELVLVTRSQVPARDWVRTYNNIRPNSPELIRLYQTCDLFVLPTQAEAFGIAAVEASAAGLPVIATRVGGLTDIVIDGETGFLISPASKDELANRLLTLIEEADLRKRMGQASRARAERYFDARKNASRIIETLCEVVNSE